uniref:Uncharacterized protein n=1 Tax=Timema cristinae TaxID=61476 RepID=A0A7R9D927_TIMCR|nr:unnamed protein product [Timema cristinae]
MRKSWQRESRWNMRKSQGGEVGCWSQQCELWWGDRVIFPVSCWLASIVYGHVQFNSEQCRTLYVCLRTCTLENIAERPLLGRKKRSLLKRTLTGPGDCNTFISAHPQGMGCEITTCSFVTDPLMSHSQPVPDRRKELFLFVTGPRIKYTLEQVQSNLAPRICHRQRWNRSGATLFLVSLSQAALEQVQSNLAPRIYHRQHCNRSGATLFLVSLSQAAPEQVQSSLAPRICHRQHCNRSGATLFLYALEIFRAVVQ